MIKQFTRMDAYKMNILALVKSHKKDCAIEDCTVSLLLVREMCEKFGITFTKEEKELFL